MVLKNGVKNIQAGTYNGGRTVEERNFKALQKIHLTRMYHFIKVIKMSFFLGDDKCSVLDLRKPQDEWAWDVTVIPILKKKLDFFVMEYVKLTKKIYVLGGRVGGGNSNPDGEASNEVIITIKFSNALLNNNKIVYYIVTTNNMPFIIDI